PPPDPLVVVYEDDAVLVVDKPDGLVTHPAYRNPDGTLWDQLVPWFAARGLGRPAMLHRLDRATSGALCVPKHLEAHRRLERALRAGKFEKEYLALVHGRPDDAGTIDAPLARDPADRRRIVPCSAGKPARTRYTVVRRFSAHALLRVTLETGRTHQIRAHLAGLGFPVAGDLVYGGTDPALSRLFLHADRLAFPRVDGPGMVRCRAPLPVELRGVLYRLREGGAGPPAEARGLRLRPDGRDDG
ncbi:MAG TPA: RluA family pseudouridine synthase, partial [Chloroflexota bacterium]|nr:RluA family pseudouridine synthase [Chloroflexota bacterium]